MNEEPGDASNNMLSQGVQAADAACVYVLRGNACSVNGGLGTVRVDVYPKRKACGKMNLMLGNQVPNLLLLTILA
eukprot:4086207-Prorocentrum_lima.AAC.1